MPLECLYLLMRGTLTTSSVVAPAAQLLNTASGVVIGSKEGTLVEVDAECVMYFKSPSPPGKAAAATSRQNQAGGNVFGQVESAESNETIRTWPTGCAMETTETTGKNGSADF